MDLKKTLLTLRKHPEFVELTGFTGIRIDLKYATTDNFMKKNVYGEFNVGFLHQIAAEKLVRAVDFLRARNPGYELIIFDALRPRSVQRVLWSFVEGTAQEAYVANPDRGSVHNYGFAVDLSVLDSHGKELDMGTAFDTFLPLSQPKLEEHFLEKGELTQAQVANRRILREAMQAGGFIQLPHEWWHYDALPPDRVRAEFQIVE